MLKHKNYPEVYCLKYLTMSSRNVTFRISKSMENTKILWSKQKEKSSTQRNCKKCKKFPKDRNRNLIQENKTSLSHHRFPATGGVHKVIGASAIGARTSKNFGLRGQRSANGDQFASSHDRFTLDTPLTRPEHTYTQIRLYTYERFRTRTDTETQRNT